eukprot:5064560-Prymnesium_polylepis.2
MTVVFPNLLASGDRIVVRTEKNVQAVTIGEDVASYTPVSLLLPCGDTVQSVCHVPNSLVALYGLQAQKERVQKYIRKRTLAERKRRLHEARVQRFDAPGLVRKDGKPDMRYAANAS